MSEENSPPKQNNLLIWSIILSQVAPPFMFSGVAVALPDMGHKLHAGAVSLGLVETLFLTSQLSFLLPVGRLADAGDKRSLYKFAFIGYWLSCLLIALSSSMPLILALRFLQGMCSAVFAATGLAILADIVPKETRGKYFGASIGAIYAGLALGPVCAGFLVDLFGWRGVFTAGGILLAAGYVLMVYILPSKWKTPPRDTVHIPSAMLITASVLGLVGGTAGIREGFIGYSAITISFCLIMLFVWWQGKLEKPLLNIKKMMENFRLRKALLVQLLLYMNAFCLVFLLSIYMQVLLHHSAKISGQVLAIGSVLMVVAAPFAGRLSDKFQPRNVALAGVVCVMISTLMGLHLGTDTPLGFITAMLIIHGLGYALFSSPNMSIIMGSVPEQFYGIASALGAKARSIGMMAGMLVTNLLISLHIGNATVASHGPEFLNIMMTAYKILTVTTFVALALSIVKAKPQGDGALSSR